MLGEGYITFILGNGMSYKAVAMERITIGDFEHCEVGIYLEKERVRVEIARWEGKLGDWE